MPILFDAVGHHKSRSGLSQSKHFSLVDFGTDTIKAMVVRKEKSGVRVLGYGFASAEGRSLRGGRAEMVELAAIVDRALAAAEDQTEAAGRRKVVPDEALFCIPSQLTRGECFTVQQTRTDPTVPIASRELKSMWERVERLARERLTLPGDDREAWKPLALTPGPAMVDDHYVTDPVGLKGRELSLSTFGVAVRPSALKTVAMVAERLELALVNVVSASQALASVLPQWDGVLIDIGAYGTSVQLIQHDALVATSWWPQGGEFFTEYLSRIFSCSRDDAEALKRAYSDSALSTTDKALVARSLGKPVSTWVETLVTNLRQMGAEALARRSMNGPISASHAGALPGRIYLTGGGSLLPDLSQALSALEATTSLSFRRSIEIEPLGVMLGVRTPGRLALLNVPPHPLSELLTPAIGLATCLE
jgi:cell division ATPase FtsA